MLGFHAFNSLRHTHTHTHKRKASALKQPLATVIDEKCSSRIESCRDTAPFSNGSIPPRSTRCLLLFCRVLFCFGPIQFLLVATWSHYCSGFHLVLGRDPSPGTTHQLGSPALLDCSDVTSNGTEKRNSINLEISGSPFRTHLGSNRIAAEQVTFWFCKSKSRPYSTEKKDRPLCAKCSITHQYREKKIFFSRTVSILRWFLWWVNEENSSNNGGEQFPLPRGILFRDTGRNGKCLENFNQSREEMGNAVKTTNERNC